MKMRVPQKVLSLGLAMAMILCIGGAALASTTPTPAPAGDPDYVSMHNYMSKTDIPGVYKVTMSLQTPAVATTKGPVYIAVTLDQTTSMYYSDVWDSTGSYNWSMSPTLQAPGLTSRYAAMEAAVEAMVKALEADGNKQIYLNISTHDGNQGNATTTGMPVVLNSIATNGFVSLYDDVTGNVRSIFRRNNAADSNWFMYGWERYMWSSGRTNPNGWAGTSGTNDFQIPFRRIHNLFKNGLVSGNIPDNAVLFILGMGDGADTGATSSPSTLEVATALKAPRDSNFKNTGGSTTAAKTVMGYDGGLGATIWTVAVGQDIAHLPMHETDVLASNWQTLWSAAPPPWGSWAVYAEPWMIADSAIIPEAQQNSLPTASVGNSNTVWAMYQGWYSGKVKLENRKDINYAFSSYIDQAGTGLNARGESLMDSFADFGTAAAQAATSEHGGLKGRIKLNSIYELYTYPGKPIFDLSSTDPTTVQSVTQSGGYIEWTIDKLVSNSYLTLVFYVKIDESAQPSLYYPLFDQGTLTYIPNGETDTVTKFFPVPYANPGGETQDGTGGGYGGSGLPSDPNGIPVGSGGTTGTGTGSSTGAAGHQENRELASDGTGGWGTGSDVAPNVTGVKSGTDSSGRSKVEVSVSNGNQMRYQWQFKNAAGEWEDIFGATGSHYTLGKQFAAGQEYELRAKIINPAGKASFTDSVKLTVEAGNGGGLQSKEEGPSIDGESLMDAGEEITVANTASNGQILSVIAGIVVIALAAVVIVSYRRRKVVEEE